MTERTSIIGGQPIQYYMQDGDNDCVFACVKTILMWNNVKRTYNQVKGSVKSTAGKMNDAVVRRLLNKNGITANASKFPCTFVDLQPHLTTFPLLVSINPAAGHAGIIHSAVDPHGIYRYVDPSSGGGVIALGEGGGYPTFQPINANGRYRIMQFYVITGCLREELYGII